MNILVGISNTPVLEKMKILSSLDKNINIIYTSNYKDGLEKYNNNNIDIFIVDFTNENFNKLLNSILNANKQQKVIIISNSLKPSVSEGCNHCLQTFNRKRLLDTFDIIEGYNLIKNFDSINCKFIDSFVNIIENLDRILLRYEDVNYNNQTQTIHLNKNNHHQITNLLNIQNLLNQFNIKHTINDINSIQIQSN